jgi:hypothetical protein
VALGETMIVAGVGCKRLGLDPNFLRFDYQLTRELVGSIKQKTLQQHDTVMSVIVDGA